MILTDRDTIRKLVFECSVVYARALLPTPYGEGKTVQEAEWARRATLDAMMRAEWGAE